MAYVRNATGEVTSISFDSGEIAADSGSLNFEFLPHSVEICGILIRQQIYAHIDAAHQISGVNITQRVVVSLNGTVAENSSVNASTVVFQLSYENEPATPAQYIEGGGVGWVGQLLSDPESPLYVHDTNVFDGVEPVLALHVQKPVPPNLLNGIDDIDSWVQLISRVGLYMRSLEASLSSLSSSVRGYG